MTDRYVVLGLAPARAPWFRAVAAWATAASIPVEFVKCVSIEEVRARVASGRPWSAVLVDGRLPSLDRDLVDRCRQAGVAVLVVEDPQSSRDWRLLGVHRVLAHDFERRAFLDALAACAPAVTRPDTLPGDPVDIGVGLHDRARAHATTIVACGPGGTGTSTVAAALAQGLADERMAGEVLLADLSLHAEQAVLHDVGDVVPGVQELVEAFRTGRGDIGSTVFTVEARGYDLLLGLRRARAWSTLRPRAFQAALEALRATYDVVVCDTDGDLEGEEEGGSADVEDRHVMARNAVRVADMVLVVGAPGMKGLHSLVRVVDDVHGLGAAPERIVPIVNRAPRSRRARAETVAALAALTSSTATAGAVFLPERNVDEAFRDGVRLPLALTAPLVGACRAVRRRTMVADEPVRVMPGTMTAWSG